MLSFMNSKLSWLGKASKTTFSKKSKSYEIPVQSYILVKTRNLLFMYFYWCIPLDHEIYTKCKKEHPTWLKVYLVIKSALKIQKVKKPFRCPGWKKIEKLTIGGGDGRLFGTWDQFQVEKLKILDQT